MPSFVPSAPPTPIRCAADAIHLLSLVVPDPLVHCTLAFLLDEHGIGGVVFDVGSTVRPDDMLDVVEVFCAAAERTPHADSLVVTSVRPTSGVLPGDIDRWLEATDIAARHGVELIEWYVVGPHGIECPRDLFGEPERWPCGS